MLYGRGSVSVLAWGTYGVACICILNIDTRVRTLYGYACTAYACIACTLCMYCLCMYTRCILTHVLSFLLCCTASRIFHTCALSARSSTHFLCLLHCACLTTCCYACAPLALCCLTCYMLNTASLVTCYTQRHLSQTLLAGTSVLPWA